MQFAYKYGKSIHVIPSFNVNLVIIPVLGGALVFSEIVTFFQLTGVLLILSGVVFLGVSGKRRKDGYTAHQNVSE
mgnify:CR=1 FL=1